MTTKVSNSMLESAPVSVLDFMTDIQKSDVLSRAAAEDVTVPIQNAIDYCIANKRNLVVAGKCRITAPLIIDRMVDGWEQEYFVISGNPGGTIYIGNQTINMFSSSISGDSVSQFVWFEGVTFEQEYTSNASYVLDGSKFLRITFHGCLFYKMKLLTTSNYIQSYRLDNCNARYGTGTFLNSPVWNFDVHVHEMEFEAWHGSGFSMKKPQGCSFHGNVLEGFNGDALRLYGTIGVSIVGNYFEGNTGFDVNFASSELNYGIFMSGNNLASVQWSGKEKGAVSIGNAGLSDTSLHSNVFGGVFINDRIFSGTGTVTDDDKYDSSSLIIKDNVQLSSGLESFGGKIFTTDSGLSPAAGWGGYIEGVAIPGRGSRLNIGVKDGGTGYAPLKVEYESTALKGVVYVGLGSPSTSYWFEVASDSAAKPSSSTWTILSDERLKDNIIPADINRCYDIVKDLPLKRYTWKDEVYTPEQVPDRSKLGWIAQDVQPVFGKAVKSEDRILPDGSEIKDCLDLNTDQIYAVMYGAIQALQLKVETLEKLTEHM